MAETDLVRCFDKENNQEDRPCKDFLAYFHIYFKLLLYLSWKRGRPTACPVKNNCVTTPSKKQFNFMRFRSRININIGINGSYGFRVIWSTKIFVNM